MTVAHPLYGHAISDALSRSDLTTEELLAMRQHAHAVLQAQGDLEAALHRLEAEIDRRQGSGG